MNEQSFACTVIVCCSSCGLRPIFDILAMSIISLVQSAFGRKATLYTPLNCTKTSSQSELRSAYKKAALRFHPDRSNANNTENSSNNDGGDTTLKFQAVSAAYQVLMDEKRRAVYDASGRILEEHDDDTLSSDDDEGKQHKSKRPRNQTQQQWEDFFQSIFNEIIITGSQHETHAKTYSGSGQEKSDVLKYYKMCKGDMQKVLECVVHATQEDIGRWRKDIIDPAISRGDIDNFFNNDVNATKKGKTKEKCSTSLEDSSSSEDDAMLTSRTSSIKPKRLRRGADIVIKESSCLVDTDDEFEDCNIKASKSPQPKKKSETKSTSVATMSMREKMDYRVAKKRKIKAQKEMEIAQIVQSKNWDGRSTQIHFRDKPDKRMNRGGVSDQLLSEIERKYATKSHSKKRTRKR
eukprot:scaffold2927_cov125-Skeletonema_menzelii.AAC.7